MTSPWRKPSMGDIIETKPKYVSASSNLHGENPLSYGGETVIIKKRNLDEVFSGDLKEDLNRKTGFRISDAPTHPAKVVAFTDGGFIVEFLPEDEVPDNEESESLFDSPERSEPVNGEWEGTPQETSRDQAKKRKNTFNKGDERGSKNDLL